MTIAETAKCLDLDLPVAMGASFAGAAVDSREVRPGNLFVCVRGERADGHDYAAAAQKNGAAAILAGRHLDGLDIPVLVVPDTVKALGALAAMCRDKTRAKVICLTGTAGKTTLKDTLAAIMSQAGKTAATKGNHNNQIGLPLTMLNAEGGEKFWIIEAGISHAGDMDDLGAIARPDLAIILNVGIGHTGGLGGMGVAWNKTRLLKYLAPGGAALVSADYPDLVAETRKLGIKPVYFTAAGKEADFAATGGEPEKGLYILRLGKDSHKFQTPFFGEYGAETAIAAAGAATLCGVGADGIRKGFAGVSLPPQRFRLLKIGGWHVFDDTYNANPLSMRRMLLAAAEYAREHKLPLVAVLGEMGELGERAAECHKEIGCLLGEIKPVKIFWKGEWLAEARKGIAKAGYATSVCPIVDGEDFAMSWKSSLSDLPGAGVIIFKGSRANRLEKTLEAFKRLIQGEAHVL